MTLIQILEEKRGERTMGKGDGEPQPAGKPKAAIDARAERLAAALRANLKRRKAQARDRAASSEEPSPARRETGPKSR
jgi:hypothetical protein